jgi:hypothetical protein
MLPPERVQWESFVVFSAYVVEVGEQQADIVVLEEARFRFLAPLKGRGSRT